MTDELNLQERAITSAALLAYFLSGYFSIHHLLRPGVVFDLSLPIDQKIVFSPIWVWPYLWALPAAAAPAFIVNSRDLFRRAALAYFMAITISLTLFVAVPETAVALRPSTLGLHLARPSEWLVANVYAVDPPGNLFPSLHLSMTTLSALATFKADRRLGYAAFVGLALVAVAACMVKQHFIVDVAAGVTLAALVAAPSLARYRTSRVARHGDVGRGALLFAIFAALFYGAIVVAFFAGWRLHRCPDVTGACMAAATPLERGDADARERLAISYP